MVIRQDPYLHKAFDLVNESMLLQKLSLYGFYNDIIQCMVQVLLSHKARTMFFYRRKNLLLYVTSGVPPVLSSWAVTISHFYDNDMDLSL